MLTPQYQPIVEEAARQLLAVGGGGGRIKLFGENALAVTGTTSVVGGAGGPNGTVAGGEDGVDGTVNQNGAFDFEEIGTTVGPETTVPVELMTFTIE